MRLTLLEIINSDTAGHKDKTEAVKALARMHSLLQADRTVEKAPEKKIPLSGQTQKELNERLNAILNTGFGHREGQGTPS